MPRLLAILALLAGSSCSLHRISQGALLSCSALDIQQTISAKRQGATELNPIFRNPDGSANIARLAAIKGGALSTYVIAQELDGSPKRRKLYTVLNVGIAAAHCTALGVSRNRR